MHERAAEFNEPARDRYRIDLADGGRNSDLIATITSCTNSLDFDTVTNHCDTGTTSVADPDDSEYSRLEYRRCPLVLYRYEAPDDHRSDPH